MNFFLLFRPWFLILVIFMNPPHLCADPLETLRPGHPRLLITPERVGELRGRVELMLE